MVVHGRRVMKPRRPPTAGCRRRSRPASRWPAAPVLPWPMRSGNRWSGDSAPTSPRSGCTLKGRIDAKVQGFIDATHGRYGHSVATIKQRYHLYFETVTGRGGGRATATKFWTRAAIEAADHMGPVRAGNLAEIGGDGRVMVFPNETGGIGKQFRWPGDIDRGERNWFKSPFEVKSKRFETEDDESTELGQLTINVKANDRNWRTFEDGDQTIRVTRFTGAQYAGYVQKASVLSSLRKLRHTMSGSARYRRGMLDGTIEIGVTNRGLDEQGRPTGEPEQLLKVYGGGELSLQIAPWLQATAGVQFAPNGEITVSGEVGLPSQLEIFSRKEIDKRIFSLSFPIPIVPGLSAEIGGSLSANAGIGPGVIDQLRLGVVYTPSAEQDTRVSGDAHLNIPADAGLRLAVRAGLAIGIPGVGVSGGLELGGTLGLEGAAEAGVHIDWTPSEGLAIDAFGRIYVQPKFKFDISGYVEAKALFFTVYENRWELASFEVGSNLRFGICFPIHYREGEPFDISLDDVVFEVPDVSPRQIIGDLIDRIA